LKDVLRRDYLCVGLINGTFDAENKAIAGYVVKRNSLATSPLTLAEGYKLVRIGAETGENATDFYLIGSGEDAASDNYKLTGGSYLTDPTAYVKTGYLVSATTEGKVTTYKVYRPDQTIANPVELTNKEPAVEDKLSTDQSATQEKKGAAQKVKETLNDSTASSSMDISGAGVTNATSSLVQDNEVKASDNTYRDETGKESTSSIVDAVKATKSSDTDNATSETVSIVVQSYADIAVEDVTMKSSDHGETKIVEIQLDIAPKYQKVATTNDIAERAKTDPSVIITDPNDNNQNAVKIDLPQELKVEDPVVVRIPLPVDFVDNDGNQYKTSDKLRIVHTKEDGTEYIYEGAVTNDGINYYVEFTNPNGFSRFRVGPWKEPVAKIGKNYFATLAKAVNAVKNGETITLLANITAETVTVERVVNFTLDKGTFINGATIQAGNGYSMSEASGTYTFTQNQSAACTEITAKTFAAGENQQLLINGKLVIGTYTITKTAKGFTVYDGKQYLAFNPTTKAFILQDASYEWQAGRNTLYATVTGRSYNRGWFGWWRPTSTKTNYYLTWNATDGFSVSTRSAKVQLGVTVHYADHDYLYNAKDENEHTVTCSRCDYTATEKHVGDICTKCGYVQTSAASVKVECGVEYEPGYWFFWWSRPSYTAWADVRATGTEISKIQISSDGETWRNAQYFTSHRNITKFFVKVTTKSGDTTCWQYKDGKTTRLLK